MIKPASTHWVECGNDSFRSNRYGFYDIQAQKYLDFLNGELKAIQIVQIMAGQEFPAECSLNQFGEPSPRKARVASKRWKEFGEYGYGKRVEPLVEETKTLTHWQ